MDVPSSTCFQGRSESPRYHAMTADHAKILMPEPRALLIITERVRHALSRRAVEGGRGSGGPKDLVKRYLLSFL